MPQYLAGEPLAVLTKLSAQLDQAIPIVDLYEGYYEGEQRLVQLGLAIPPELRRFIVIVNWPRIAVDAVEERLERRGFKLPGQLAADPGLWEGWLYNGLDELGPMGDRDALKIGRSYRILGANEDDPEFPRISVESPRECTVIRDPRTLKIQWGLKRYNVVNTRAQSASLYSENETWWLEADGGQWAVVDYNRHNIGACLMTVSVNRPRIGLPADGRPLGTSEMKDVIGVTDAAARNLTNAQVAQETHAIPQRVVSGAAASDFVNPDTGEMLPVWQTYFGAVWAMTNPEAKATQFSASDMSNFERMQDLYARQASALSATPPNYFGLKADDAASADAIRSREARLDRKCERRIQAFRASDKETLNIYVRIRDGEWNPDMARLWGDWENPATPTEAQKTDAVVKKFQAKIIPRERAQLDLGYTPDEVAEMAEMFAREANDPVMQALTKNLVPAQQQAVTSGAA